MFDLKMCLMDLMRLQVSPKPKKSLKEISSRYSLNFMQKYHDLNIIHFNENMSMTSRQNTMKFARCPGAFSTSPISNSFSNRKKSIRDYKGLEGINFELSSDDRAGTSSDDGELSDTRATASPMDSFCTLCTSSFSYSNCNNCEQSACSSKCSAEESCLCCKDRSVAVER